MTEDEKNVLHLSGQSDRPVTSHAAAEGEEAFESVWADYTRNPRTQNASVEVCRHFFEAGRRSLPASDETIEAMAFAARAERHRLYAETPAKHGSAHSKEQMDAIEVASMRAAIAVLAGYRARDSEGGA